ncbi:MAG: extracellular solute-binding protein [Streptosporangiales bacterium]|nr:extracellular solute-binding protein [Streptosporangiales bacterium]
MTAQHSLPGPSRRDVLRGAGGLAALGALAACGSNTGRPQEDTTGLSQWYHQYGEAGTQQAAKRYAKAYKDASVSVQWVPGDYAKKLSSGLLSSDGPDVFEYQFNQSLAKAKQVVALDDVVADVKDDFNEIDLATNTYEGKLYGIRMIDDPQLIYYRKSLLSKAGIEPPDTVDKLVAAAKALTRDKRKGLFAGNDPGLPLGQVALVAAGHDLLTEGDRPEPDLANARTAKALSALRQMYVDKSLLVGNPTDWTDPSAFTQELVAMQWLGLWAMPAVQKAFGDDFGVLPFPALDDEGKASVYSGGWTAFVSAKAKDVDAAKAYLKWLWVDKTDFQEDWCLSYGFHIPPRKSLAEKAEKLQSGPAAEAVRLNSERGIADFPAWTPTMRTAFNDAVNRIVRKGTKPQTEMTKVAAKVRKELAG